MKAYLTNQIINVGIFGHLGSGKTSLIESILYISKTIDQKGEVEKKNTVSDYLVEEQTKLSSLNVTLIPVEYNDYKINFIDTPGNSEFVQEIDNVYEVINGAILVIDAKKGVEFSTSRIYNELKKRGIPSFLFLNKFDQENIKYLDLKNQITEHFGKSVLPLCLPLGKDNSFDGYINTVIKKAYIFDGEKCNESEIYLDKIDKCNELHEQILEAVATTSDELMEKYLSEKIMSTKEISSGLRNGIISGDLSPILVGSAKKNIGINTLLNMICEYLQSPNYQTDPDAVNEIVIKSIDNEPLSAYVFKTIIDKFLGPINFIKVYSGVITKNSEIFIANLDKSINISNVYVMRGKNLIEVERVFCEDICVITKAQELRTGYTLCDKKHIVKFKTNVIEQPIYHEAITANSRNDETKLSNALKKLSIEDPHFETVYNKETSQLLLGTQGPSHTEYIIARLKNLFNVNVSTSTPKIVYRESIKGSCTAQGRHKKQSGGAGQFGDVHIRFEPSLKDFEFFTEVIGGAVPKVYFPAVEKGLQEALLKGILAGYPVIGVKATLFDGTSHSVDSNELSFKLAAILAFKNASKKLNPIILEPISCLTIITSNEYVGDILSDLSKRRGQIQKMTPIGTKHQEITANVPDSEIITYAVDLKANTQGSGYFTKKFLKYEELPSVKMCKVIEDSKK